MGIMRLMKGFDSPTQSLEFENKSGALKIAYLSFLCHFSRDDKGRMWVCQYHAQIHRKIKLSNRHHTHYFFFSKAHPNGTSIQCLFYGFLNLKIKLHNSNYKFIKLA